MKSPSLLLYQNIYSCFLLSLSEAYFLDDMVPLKFRETISQRLRGCSAGWLGSPLTNHCSREQWFQPEQYFGLFFSPAEQALNNLQIWNSKWCPSGSVKSESMINLYLSGRQYMVREYSLYPLLPVVFGFRAISLTRFIENACNICISK